MPKILIAATSRWLPTARLAMAFANAGCTIEVVCPPRHLLNKTSVVAQAYAYEGLTPLISFADAISAAQPDFIVPGDDLATRHLHQLHQKQCGKGKAGIQIRALIERSLGGPESFETVHARTSFMELARQEGIRVPETEIIANSEDLRKWIARVGCPTVLKANGTSGGDGVKIVYTVEEAERAFRSLQAPPLFVRAAKRALFDHDRTLLEPSLLRRRSVVNGQAFVEGHEATSAIACWSGRVLAELHFEVLKKRSSAGPATVLRSIENPEMSSAAARMVRRLNLSGVHGFDYMLEARTGNSYLIEINPRATQVGHLTLGPGRDLPAALYAALSGQPFQAAPKVTENETIALFPNEWMRDPSSGFLRSAYHDVPWEEPELVRSCLRKAGKQRAWHSQQELVAGFYQQYASGSVDSQVNGRWSSAD